MIGLKRQSKRKKFSLVILFAFILNIFVFGSFGQIVFASEQFIEAENFLSGGTIEVNTNYSNNRAYSTKNYFSFTVTGNSIRIPVTYYLNSSGTYFYVQIDGVQVYKYTATSKITRSETLYFDLDGKAHAFKIGVNDSSNGSYAILDYIIIDVEHYKILLRYLYQYDGDLFLVYDNSAKGLERRVYVNGKLVQTFSTNTQNYGLNIYNYHLPEYGFYTVQFATYNETTGEEVYSNVLSYTFNPVPDPPVRYEFESILQPGWDNGGTYLINPNGKSANYYVNFKGENIKIVGQSFGSTQITYSGSFNIYIDGLLKENVKINSTSYQTFTKKYTALGNGVHTLRIEALNGFGTKLDYFETYILPSIPQITNINTEYDTVTLNWIQTQSTNSYNILVNDAIVATNIPVTTTSFIYKVNSPGLYKFNIEAVNSEGGTKSQDYYLNITMLPGKPSVNYSIYRDELTLNFNAIGAISYKIFVNNVVAGEITGGNNFTYKIPQNDNYSIYVTACNLYGETVGDTINLGYIYVPPAKPNLFYTIVQGAIKFYWDHVANALQYILTKDNQETLTITNNTYYDFNLKNLLNSGLYNFKLLAKNNSYTTEGDILQVLFLARPKSLTGKYNNGEIEVTWKQDNFAEGYYIERSEDGQIFRTVAQTSQNSYIDTDVKPNKKYYYRVKSFNTAY